VFKGCAEEKEENGGLHEEQDGNDGQGTVTQLDQGEPLQLVLQVWRRSGGYETREKKQGEIEEERRSELKF